jgi:hypothetical protein
MLAKGSARMLQQSNLLLVYWIANSSSACSTGAWPMFLSIQRLSCSCVLGYADRSMQSGLECCSDSAGDEGWCAIGYSVSCVLRRDYPAKHFTRNATRAGGIGLV